jgi:hypothetical protein
MKRTAIVMKRRSAMIVAGWLVGAMMVGTAGAAQRALDLKVAASRPNVIVVQQAPAPAPALPQSVQPSEESD